MGKVEHLLREYPIDGSSIHLDARVQLRDLWGEIRPIVGQTYRYCWEVIVESVYNLPNVSVTIRVLFKIDSSDSPLVEIEEYGLDPNRDRIPKYRIGGGVGIPGTPIQVYGETELSSEVTAERIGTYGYEFGWRSVDLKPKLKKSFSGYLNVRFSDEQPLRLILLSEAHFRRKPHGGLFQRIFRRAPRTRYDGPTSVIDENRTRNATKVITPITANNGEVHA